MAEDFALVPGSRISHYRVESRIGAGGMGEVFLATDLTLERPVALKILPPALLSDAERVRRFVQEAKSASALNHPNIVTIYEIGQAPVLAGEMTTLTPPTDLPSSTSNHIVHYMAMEFIDGKTLRSMIYGDTPLPELLRVMAQAADGLAKAHDAGIVHRDLKPDNIMVTSDGYAKIVDFGLAKLTEKSAGRDQNLTQEGMVMGTVGYMSPEQVEGSVIQPASDVFSFGCMIFECATKKRPFESDLAIDTLHKIMFSEPLPIVAVNAAAPNALQPVIDRCLRKKAADRYTTIREVAVALREIAPGSGPVTQPAFASSPGLAIPRSGGTQAPAFSGSQPVAKPVEWAPEVRGVEQTVSRKVARAVSTAYRVGLLAVVASIAYIWLTMPNVSALAQQKPSGVVDWADYDHISPSVRRSVVAAVDADYYKRRVFRLSDADAFFNAGSQKQRALYLPSPLTRAAAHQIYPLPKWNLLRPVRDFAVAASMERQLTRRRIVELYLNVANFGDATGVAQATKRYWKKAPSRLSDKEAALLAASLKGGDPANPSPELAALQASILGRMPRSQAAEPSKKSDAKKTSSKKSGKRTEPAPAATPAATEDDAAAFGGEEKTPPG